MATALRHHPAKKMLGHTTVALNSRKLRQQYSIPQNLLARLMGVSLRTISTLDSHSAEDSGLRRSFVQVARLCGALATAMKPAYVGQWLDEPNEMLDGFKPVESIERGHLD